MQQTCNICDYSVSTRGLSEHLQSIRNDIQDHNGNWIVTLNTEMLAKGHKEPEYKALLQSADTIVADGMPLVWTAKMKKNCINITERTTGVDLVNDLLSQEPIPDFAIIGGVNPQQTLETRFPQAVKHCRFLFTGIVKLDDSEISHFANEILKHKVSIVYIALGVPKQDKLALALRKKCPGVTLVGIGGTFEILGPDGHRAPLWMQKSGLEWLYRFSREPRRLWKRYVLNYPTGIRLLFNDLTRSQQHTQT